MKKYRFLKYIGVILSMTLCLAGCQNADGQEENPDTTANSEENSEVNEEGILDAEEYFNSLIDDDSSDYQSSPNASDDFLNGDTTGTDNSDTKDDSLTQNLDDVIEIEELYSGNGYMQIVPMGETCSVDLNNDGTEDIITYNATTSDIEDYGTTVEEFTINGGDYKYTLYLSNQGIHIQDPDLEWYYITDLNTRDSYKEIAILDHGANGIPYTYFIRFVGSGTYCLGYVPYFPDDFCFEIKGDGSIESAYDLQLLPGYQASALWLSGSDQRIESNLTMRNPDLFYLYDNQYVNDMTQLKDLQLYTSRSKTGTTIEAKASDYAVSFTQTDDEHWVYMKRDDGVEGWIYFEDANTIVSGGKKYNRRDVFAN